MKTVTSKQVSPHGVVSYTTGAVVQDAGRQFAAKKTIFKTHQVLWYLLGAVEILLTFRFLLRLLGANPASTFVSFIYDVSLLFVAPFRGIFGTPSIGGGAAIEWFTIVAMVVYYVAILGIVKLFQILKPVSPTEVEQQVD